MTAPNPLGLLVEGNFHGPVGRHHHDYPRGDRWTPAGQPPSWRPGRPTASAQSSVSPPEFREALADAYFLTAHDPATGAPLIHLTRIGIGLAGALLGELVQDHRINARGGRLEVRDASPPPDALEHLVLEYLLFEPDVDDVGTWLEFFRIQARDLVGDRLLRTGLVERGKSRRQTVFVPLDYGKAAWRVARIEQQVSQFGRLTPTDTAVVGFMAATGLHTKVLTDTGRDVFAHLGTLVEGLPPPLYELVCHVRSQIDKAVH